MLVQLTTVHAGNFWENVLWTFGKNITLLRKTPVAVIFRDQDVLTIREIGPHCPPHMVIGVNFRWCSDTQCRTSNHTVFFKTKSNANNTVEYLRQICRKCGSQSQWVKIPDLTWAHPVSKDRLAYWHNYPIPPANLVIFTTAEDGDDDGGVAGKEGQQVAGNVRQQAPSSSRSRKRANTGSSAGVRRRPKKRGTS